MIPQFFRLDYISCGLTLLSTFLVGRRKWQGWIVAGANSVIICVIGWQTSQTGFIPANVFCLGMYGYNVMHWRTKAPSDVSSRTSLRSTHPAAAAQPEQSAQRHRLFLVS